MRPHTLFATALSAICAVATASTATAEVTSSAANGFAISHESVVGAAPDAIWAALVEPAGWWNGDHSWSADAANFSLEPVAGGCFCETWDGGQVIHLTVASVMPGKRITLRGALGPLQDHGVDGALTMVLTEAEGGGTTLTTTYRVGGYIDGMDNWAAPVDGVIGEQHARLVRLVETGSPEPQ